MKDISENNVKNKDKIPSIPPTMDTTVEIRDKLCSLKGTFIKLLFLLPFNVLPFFEASVIGTKVKLLSKIAIKYVMYTIYHK